MDKFIKQIRWLYEPEFGDFKRKVGLYIHRLEEENPKLQSTEAKKIIAQMRFAVTYDPNGDIESTRLKIIQLAGDLAVTVGETVH
jgi:hypothetical protein